MLLLSSQSHIQRIDWIELAAQAGEGTAVSGHSDGALWEIYIRLELVRRHCCISKLPWQCHSPFHCLLPLSPSKVTRSNNHRDSVLYTYSSWELFPATSSTFKLRYILHTMLLFIGYITSYRDNKKTERLSLNSSSEIFLGFIPLNTVWWIAAYYAVVVLKHNSLGVQGFIRAHCEIIQLMPIFNQLHAHNRTEVLQWIPHRPQSVTLGDVAMLYFIICFISSYALCSVV